MQRRRLVALLPALPLAGCGFRLRRPAELPFGSLALTGFARDSALEAEFRRTLAGAVAIPERAGRRPTSCCAR